MGYYCAVSSYRILPPRPSSRRWLGCREREGDSGGCQEEEGDETQRQKLVSHWTSSPVPEPINHTDVVENTASENPCMLVFSVRVFKMVRKCVWVFLSVETYGFTDALLSNSSCLASGLLSSGHNIVVYHWEISTTHIHLIYSAI